VYGQAGGEHHQHDPGIIAYRNKWLDQLATGNSLQAIITFGSLAAGAYSSWIAGPIGKASQAHHAAVLHPTFPESASATGTISLAAATKQLLDNWNAALPGLRAAINRTDQPPNVQPYAEAFVPGDLAPIPAADLPPGLPAWMRSLEAWASRTGATSDAKRATITVVVPLDQRPWTPSSP
jgi:uracil-DNA glycosylase